MSQVTQLSDDNKMTGWMVDDVLLIMITIII